MVLSIRLSIGCCVFGVLFFSPRLPLAVCDGAFLVYHKKFCCTCYHGGSYLLVFLVWMVMPWSFFKKALCVCGSKIDRLEMISSPWRSVNFKVPRFETRPCVKNPWWKKTGWMRNPRPETWNSSQFWQKQQLIKSEFLNHQHWNRKIWFLFMNCCGYYLDLPPALDASHLFQYYEPFFRIGNFQC